MIRVQQLRWKVKLLRRVASIPTHGDRLIDQDLVRLADQLEGEADARATETSIRGGQTSLSTPMRGRRVP